MVAIIYCKFLEAWPSVRLLLLLLLAVRAESGDLVADCLSLRLMSNSECQANDDDGSGQ